MSVKLAGSETWSFHGISCLPLNFKDDFCSLPLTFKLRRLNKLTGNELFARNHKILSSNLLMIPQTTRERILNFWFPKNRGVDSGFLTTKQHWRFRIPDPPNNTGLRISDPRLTQERIQNFWPPNWTLEIQNFWPPNNTGDSEFLTTKQHRRGFRISDPPNNTGEDSEFLILKQYKRGLIQNFWPPINTGAGIQNFWTPNWTQEIQNFWPANNTREDKEFLIP